MVSNPHALPTAPPLRVLLGEFSPQPSTSPQCFTQRPTAIFVKAFVSPFRGNLERRAKQVYSLLLTPKSSLRCLVLLQLRSSAWLTLATRVPLFQRCPAVSPRLLQPTPHGPQRDAQESPSSQASLHAGAPLGTDTPHMSPFAT